jgi:hypothetical protein
VIGTAWDRIDERINLMKRLAALLLLAGICVFPALPSAAKSNPNSARAQAKAQRKQAKAMRKYQKKQKKAQDKMFKNSQKNTHYPPQVF